MTSDAIVIFAVFFVIVLAAIAIFGWMSYVVKPFKNPEPLPHETFNQARDAERARWAAYDRAIEALVEEMHRQGPPQAYLIAQDHEGVWRIQTPDVRLPYRYNHVGARSYTEPPEIKPLRWGWDPIGIAHPTREAAEAALARLVTPDTTQYFYDKAGVLVEMVPEDKVD